MSRNTLLAAQLYTVRDFVKTPAGLAESLMKIRKIGYEAVQYSGACKLPPDELKRMLQQENLTVCATHVSYESMRTEVPELIAEHKVLNCEFTALSSLPSALRNLQGYMSFAKEASVLARKMKEGGLSLTYHNHSFELEKFEGRTGLDIIYSQSDPLYLLAEIDTYWITHGGGDPVHWIRSLKGRIPLVHLKDMAIKDNNQIMAEVGEGNLNWPEILRACKEAGVRWYIVEQDHCQRDPFESLAMSYKNLRAMGLG